MQKKWIAVAIMIAAVSGAALAGQVYAANTRELQPAYTGAVLNRKENGATRQNPVQETTRPEVKGQKEKRQSVKKQVNKQKASEKKKITDSGKVKKTDVGQKAGKTNENRQGTDHKDSKGPYVQPYSR